MLDHIFNTKYEGLEVGSRRSADPMNEFDNTDELLAGAFPCIFSLGKAYNRRVGSLSYEQRNHMLKQFTLNPSRDRRLLGYISDAMKRLEVIQKAKTNIANNQKAIDQIHELLEKKDLNKLIEETKRDPESKHAKRLYRKIEPLLLLAGGNVMYGALESSRMQTTVCKMAQ